MIFHQHHSMIYPYFQSNMSRAGGQGPGAVIKKANHAFEQEQ